MKLNNANEAGDFDVPPIGRYKAKCIASEATTSTAGNPMIKITGEVREPEEYAGAQFFDNLLTNENSKGSGFGKKKLRGLGINVDSEVEIPDEQIAADLLDREFFVDLEHKQQMGKDAAGAWTVPQFKIGKNGKQEPKLNAVPKNYYSADLQVAQSAGQGQLPQPVQVQQPQQIQPQFVQPQQVQAPQGFPPPQGMQAPQGFQQPAGAVPMPWAQQAAPQGQVVQQPQANGPVVKRGPGRPAKNP